MSNPSVCVPEASSLMRLLTRAASLAPTDGVLAVTIRFAGVVQQQRKIKQRGPLDLLKAAAHRLLYGASAFASQMRSSCSRQMSVCSSAAY